jgi:hypothetical protein
MLGSPDADQLMRFDQAHQDALRRLHDLWLRRGDEARTRLTDIRGRYVGRRAAMVVDAVMSIQQRYEVAVLPFVERFDKTPAAESLRALADLQGIDERYFNNSPGRLGTVTGVARALVRYGEERGLENEEAVVAWAAASAGLDFAPKTDPYCGVVPGVGCALLAYLRLLGGADTLKPDGRVHAALLGFGFALPPLKVTNRDGLGQHILAMGLVAAEQIGASPGELDQLLWWAET